MCVMGNTDGQTSPHRPRLVVSRSTCPPIFPPSPRKQLCTRSCSNKHTHIMPPDGWDIKNNCIRYCSNEQQQQQQQQQQDQIPRWAGGWACTSHPGVLGSIPKREEPGKTGRHPVLKYRVPHGSQCAMGRLVHTRGLGCRMHCGAEVTESSTNKQHHLLT